MLLGRFFQSASFTLSRVEQADDDDDDEWMIYARGKHPFVLFNFEEALFLSGSTNEEAVYMCFSVSGSL